MNNLYKTTYTNNQYKTTYTNNLYKTTYMNNLYQQLTKASILTITVNDHH